MVEISYLGSHFQNVDVLVLSHLNHLQLPLPVSTSRAIVDSTEKRQA